jgi:hypothetical protein
MAHNSILTRASNWLQVRLPHARSLSAADGDAAFGTFVLLERTRFLIPKVGGPAAAIWIFPREICVLAANRARTFGISCVGFCQKCATAQNSPPGFCALYEGLSFYSAVATAPQNSIVLP